MGEGFIKRKLLAQMGVAFEPDILGRILFRGLRGKAQTSDFPVGLGQVRILLGEKFPQVLSAVVTGAVPEHDEFLVRVERLAPLEIRHRIHALASGGFGHMPFVGLQIERPILGLPLPFIGHRHRNRGIAVPPRPPTHIPPHYVTFVLQQHHHRASLNLGPLRCQVFLSLPAAPAPAPRCASGCFSPCGDN